MSFGAPRDGEAPDTIILTFKTPNQVGELISKLEQEQKRMEAESDTGQLVVKGRVRK